MQRINHFKEITGNRDPSLTYEEKKAIKILSKHFQEKKFQEFIVDESKKEDISIYLLHFTSDGVHKYALITGKKPFSLEVTYKCEFIGEDCVCQKIKGHSAHFGIKRDIDSYFFKFGEKIKPKKISPSMAWECYLNLITMKFSKEYQIACDAYDRLYSKSDEDILDEILLPIKPILRKKLKERSNKIIDSIKSIGSVIEDLP